MLSLRGQLTHEQEQLPQQRRVVVLALTERLVTWQCVME